MGAAGGLAAKQAAASVHEIAAPAPLAAPVVAAGIPYGVSALSAVGGYPYAGLPNAGLGAGLPYAGIHAGLPYAGLHAGLPYAGLLAGYAGLPAGYAGLPFGLPYAGLPVVAPAKAE